MNIQDIFEARCGIKCSGDQFVWSKRGREIQKRAEKTADKQIKRRTKMVTKDPD